MSFFQQLTDKVSSLVKQTLPSKSPYDVLDINPQILTRMTVVCAEGGIKLYKDSSGYSCVLHYPQTSPNAFSLFRSNSESEAMTLYSNVGFKLQHLCQASGRIIFRETLQTFMNMLRANPSWTSAHLAIWLGLTECLRHPPIAQQLNTPDEASQCLPIQVAIQTGKMEIIQELLICGVQLNVADANGNNVYHTSASASDPRIIQYLASKDPSSLNQLNAHGESALHMASMSDKPDNLEQLLRWGANPKLTMSGRYPIHCAMKVGSLKCLEILHRWSKEQIHLQDAKYGGTPLHWARNRECVYALVDMGCSIDTPSITGETALHIMIQRNRQACVMGLLAKGAKAEAIGSRGYNALHMAIMTDNIDLVETILVFGADIDCFNEERKTPRHMAATSRSSNKDVILFLLVGVGAVRCPAGMPDCAPGCASGGNFNGLPCKAGVPTTPEHQKLHDSTMSDVAMAAAMTRSASATGSALMADMTDAAMGLSGYRVLCLDGGGIRGLILIQILLAIEKVLGQPIRQCFDWIGGTSTGGILALAIVHGKSVRQTQGFYFQLKDEVFCGKRPYASEPLENFLKKEFGEHTRMNEKDFPRVVVTGVLADRNPAELHLFRNYDPPGETYDKDPKAMFPPTPRPNEQKVWRAARCSGAAPTYFRAFGRFLDGGLISNNPTLDILTEINDYNTRLQAMGKASSVKPIHVVVSLGTGRIPPRQVNAVDVYKPEGLMDIIKVASGAKNLGEMLIEQCTQSEGQPVQRARAWCSMIGVPYFRLSPQLSEDVPLDCKEDKVLMHMLWETQCYIHRNTEKIAQLASLLQS